MNDSMAHGMPLVSVVMPAYNAQRYIRAAVRSLQEQTVGNWELLVVDDCSQDETRRLLQQLANEDARIHPIYNEYNRGAAASRNLALDRCTGEYIAFLDADDMWRPDKLARQLEKAADAGADIVYCSYAMVDEKGAPCYPDFIVGERATVDSMLSRNELSCSTVLLRRDALADRRFRTDFYHEDYVLWLELLQGGCVAVGISDVLADYRIVQHSRSNDKARSALHRWRIYRRYLHLPLSRSLSTFIRYAVGGLRKYSA